MVGAGNVKYDGPLSDEVVVEMEVGTGVAVATTDLLGTGVAVTNSGTTGELLTGTVLLEGTTTPALVCNVVSSLFAPTEVLSAATTWAVHPCGEGLGGLTDKLN